MLDREKLYITTSEAIHKIEQILERYDPLSVISVLARDLYNPLFLAFPEGYSEPLLEYLMSLALAKPYPAAVKKPPPNLREIIYEHWSILKFSVPFYIAGNRSERTEAELRFDLINRFINIRGDAYIQHLRLTSHELLESHALHLEETVGFSESNMKTFFKRIEDTIKSHGREMKAPDSSHAYEVFEIKPLGDKESLILESLSCEFGDNKEFLEVPKWRGWPTNDTIISSRPIIKHNNRYFVFHLPLMNRNTRSFMESLLEKKSDAYYTRKYLPSRDEYLEHTAAKLLHSILPKAEVHPKLVYDVIEDNEKKHCELDSLIIYDECLVIVETKAGELRIPSKRGHPEKFERDLEDILKKAHEQATRAIQYINSAPEVTFYENKKPIIIRKEDYRHVFIVLVNFEPLYTLSTHLSTAKRLGLLAGEEWPWFVYLNDFRVISEIVEHPSTFLHYLQKRIALNELVSLKSFDELDYFMYYIRNGSFPTPEAIDPNDITLIGIHTPELDAYYDVWLEHGLVEMPKPTIEMQGSFKLLLTKLETEQPPGFTSSCFHLLDTDDTKRAEIGRVIERCERRNEESGSSMMRFRVGRIGFLFGCMNDLDEEEKKIIDEGNHCFDKMDVDEVSLFYWSPPLTTGEIRTRILNRQ
ncbi:MAG: hypothetical protein E3J86_09055 [Candidatus Thorarchaeota archaeon]|nr:MAG: hypothetical protein E3J86_09055 [Candidatus Thorarchaeota archaeon]